MVTVDMATVNHAKRVKIMDLRLEHGRICPPRMSFEPLRTNNIPHRYLIQCSHCGQILIDGVWLQSRPEQIFDTNEYMVMRAIWEEPW